MALAKIVFASMTGNTEEIADIVADNYVTWALDVDVDECTTVDASDFFSSQFFCELFQAFNIFPPRQKDQL